MAHQFGHIRPGFLMVFVFSDTSIVGTMSLEIAGACDNQLMVAGEQCKHM